MTASTVLSPIYRFPALSQPGGEGKKDPGSKDHDPWARSVTLLYKERLETFNDFFVFLNVALFRSDCVIIYILFWLAAQRINSV